MKGVESMSEGKLASNLISSIDIHFDDWDEEPVIPVHDNDELYGNMLTKEKIVVEAKDYISKFSKDNPINLHNLPKTAVLYLKRNWIFLASISLLWLFLGVSNYGFTIYKIPLVGQVYRLITSNPIKGILIYLTATYNGPVGFFGGGLNIYTLFVAILAKSTYLLAMTGIVIPSVKALTKNKQRELSLYKNNINKSKEIIHTLTKDINRLGFSIIGCGAALVVSNFLTRNGKIDKTFVLLLMSFTLLKGLSGALPSALDYILRRTISLFTLLIPGGIKNISKRSEVFRIGAMAGFLSAIVIGSFGETAGYILGMVLVLSGFVLTVIKKEIV